MCVEAGAAFSLSSDAHLPEQVGFGYDRAVEFLGDLGVEEICVFEPARRRSGAARRTGRRESDADERVGIGYDSHRFAEGRPPGAGRRRIEYERGLAGHSDADVLTHAVIDALLGAAGEGDIGTLFPDDDERWRDADSIDLLRTVVGTVAGRSSTSTRRSSARQPRIGPHRAEMERILAEATSARVSVKATTNEGMGWIGRGEGIACIAVASVESE